MQAVLHSDQVSVKAHFKPGRELCLLSRSRSHSYTVYIDVYVRVCSYLCKSLYVLYVCVLPVCPSAPATLWVLYVWVTTQGLAIYTLCWCRAQINIRLTHNNTTPQRIMVYFLDRNITVLLQCSYHNTHSKPNVPIDRSLSIDRHNLLLKGVHSSIHILCYCMCLMFSISSYICDKQQNIDPQSVN